MRKLVKLTELVDSLNRVISIDEQVIMSVLPKIVDKMSGVGSLVAARTTLMLAVWMYNSINTMSSNSLSIKDDLERMLATYETLATRPKLYIVKNEQ